MLLSPFAVAIGVDQQGETRRSFSNLLIVIVIIITIIITIITIIITITTTSSLKCFGFYDKDLIQKYSPDDKK